MMMMNRRNDESEKKKSKNLSWVLFCPVVSAVIRERVGKDEFKASGAFILTASHNPGGPNEDFGIKYNMENGGPSLEGVTEKIYENTTTIKEYLIAEDLPHVLFPILSRLISPK
ncbi:Phosphoglucomutase cytoplasmic [Bienertia sinuspersici]